jgi:hypothetical protein
MAYARYARSSIASMPAIMNVIVTPFESLQIRCIATSSRLRSHCWSVFVSRSARQRNVCNFWSVSKEERGLCKDGVKSDQQRYSPFAPPIRRRHKKPVIMVCPSLVDNASRGFDSSRLSRAGRNTANRRNSSPCLICTFF